MLKEDFQTDLKPAAVHVGGAVGGAVNVQRRRECRDELCVHGDAE